MTDTIQSFVTRLQSEGVEAGRQAAAKIEAEAGARAARIVEEAEARAGEIRAQAEADAALHRGRIEGELRLAVRDIVLELREVLSGMLQRLLAARVETQLSGEAFLKELIREVLRQYVQADGEDRSDVRINLPAEMRRQLADWAVHELGRGLVNPGRQVELHGTLQEAGFEYRVTSGTVEVTTESVAAKLHELARPELRRLLTETADTASGRGNGEAVQAQGGGR